MPLRQPALANTVISFALHAARSSCIAHETCLTPQDRMQVNSWRDRARQAGYDRMVIHDRDEGDASEVGNFLSLYARGQAWSRWGFARSGGRVRAWCCLTGTDVGEFVSLSEAFQAVLQDYSETSPQQVADAVVASNVVQVSFGGRAGNVAA